MPQLPSGLKVYLSNLAVIDLQGRKDWFKCAPGHFWYLTPNLTESPPPYRPQDEITLDFQSAPVPADRDEAMHFVHVFLEDPGWGIYWRGDWMADFHDTYPLSKDDRNFWLGWMGQNNDFLDLLIQKATAQSREVQGLTGIYSKSPRESMIGMKMPAYCLGKEIVDERVFFYALSQLMQRTHRLPAGILQLDYETAFGVVANDLRQSGFTILETERDYEADYSLIAKDPSGTQVAVKVTTTRAPLEPAFTKAEVARLKRIPRGRRNYMAPVGLLATAERSPDGHQGFHLKYTGIVEV